MHFTPQAVCPFSCNTMMHFAPGLLPCYSAPLCACLTFSETLYDLLLIKIWAFLCTATAINCPKRKVTNGTSSWRLNEARSRAIPQAFRLQTPHVHLNHRGTKAAAVGAFSVRGVKCLQLRWPRVKVSQRAHRQPLQARQDAVEARLIKVNFRLGHVLLIPHCWTAREKYPLGKSQWNWTLHCSNKYSAKILAAEVECEEIQGCRMDLSSMTL